MTQHPPKPHSSVEYTEFTVEGETIALVSDPNHAHAWIRSDHTLPVRE
ncbi:hypothetical protein SAMN04487948_12261 [Halogranum amylolyticum]|uniref:Uncharacterized protein n=1 Tax=Halogranum amylolyticum TaxID=660520 RepID=A0A1H8W2S7_9EURY|nr:hypothetical protein [Halogranum amylolyticum]SEP21952.1 hypothetical protein SAMN04487948_12261 [Halogranum amylolyticum]